MVRERSRVQSSLAAPYHPLEIKLIPCNQGPMAVLWLQYWLQTVGASWQARSGISSTVRAGITRELSSRKTFVLSSARPNSGNLSALTTGRLCVFCPVQSRSFTMRSRWLNESLQPSDPARAPPASRSEFEVHPPFPCSKCRTAEYLDVRWNVPAASDLERGLTVRRPVKKITKWIWRDERA